MYDIPQFSQNPVERRRRRASIAMVAGVLLLGLVAVAGAKAYHSGFSASFGTEPDASLNSGAPLPAPASTASPETLSQAFSAVSKTISPAVVHINIVQEVKRPSMPDFFGSQNGGGGTMRQRGSGSGVIVNGNGFILTNNHVVGKASTIEVKLADGRRLKGTVVGTDPPTDLAVVKVDASGLPTASLGDSDKLEQGDWVVAVGSPFGLEQTITAGIVSATGRRLQASSYDAFIQTDASINPGNSGGPLVNLQGEVVGINTLIFSESGGNQGIGFAIPSNTVRKVYEQLSSGDHKVVRGYLGVNIGDLTDPLAQSLNVPEGTKGAVIADVASESSPAAKAGLKSGDVITSVNGKAVSSSQELTDLVADIAPGTSIDVSYLREGKSSSVSVTVGERPATAGMRDENGDEPDSEEQGASQQKLGVTGQDVTPEIAKELRLKVESGAVITSVDPSGAAAEAGLQRGDVIHKFGRTPINAFSDLASAVRDAGNDGEVVLQVERSGRLAFLTVRLG